MRKPKNPNTTLVLGGSPAMAALQEIAKAAGYVSDRGRDTGKGSLSGMLRGLILGETVVVPRNITGALMLLAKQQGCESVPALLRDIAVERVRLNPGWAASWLKDQSIKGLQPSELELTALTKVQAILPRIVAMLIDQAVEVETLGLEALAPATPAEVRAYTDHELAALDAQKTEGEL